MIARPNGISGIYGYPKTAHLQAESLKQCKPDPPMPDQEQLDDFLEALETAGSPAENPMVEPWLAEGSIRTEAGKDLPGQGFLDFVVSGHSFLHTGGGIDPDRM